MKKFTASIKQQTKLTDQTYLVTIDQDVEYDAGQFLTFIFERDGNKFPRSYSIFNAPHEPGVTLLIKYLENGIGSQILKNALSTDEFTVMGPLGKFVYDRETNNKNHVLIATDTGLAPINAMIMEHMPNNIHKNFTLIFGARQQEGLYFHEVYKELVDLHQHFTYLPTLSREEVDGINKGYVQTLLPKDKQDTSFYICGNGNMVNDVKKILQEEGVQRKDIHYEIFD